MKKNIGPRLALYPVSITVIGAMNGETPTWTLAGHLGIIGHDRVLVSLAAPHFINGKIKETKRLSVNLVDEAMWAPSADTRRTNPACSPGSGGRPVRRS